MADELELRQSPEVRLEPQRPSWPHPHSLSPSQSTRVCVYPQDVPVSTLGWQEAGAIRKRLRKDAWDGWCLLGASEASRKSSKIISRNISYPLSRTHHCILRKMIDMCGLWDVSAQLLSQSQSCKAKHLLGDKT